MPVIEMPRSTSGMATRPVPIANSSAGPSSTYDMATQQGTSHHYRRHPDGTVTYRASNFRYI